MDEHSPPNHLPTADERCPKLLGLVGAVGLVLCITCYVVTAMRDRAPAVARQPVDSSMNLQDLGYSTHWEYYRMVERRFDQRKSELRPVTPRIEFRRSADHARLIGCNADSEILATTASSRFGDTLVRWDHNMDSESKELLDDSEPENVAVSEKSGLKWQLSRTTNGSCRVTRRNRGSAAPEVCNGNYQSVRGFVVAAIAPVALGHNDGTFHVWDFRQAPTQRAFNAPTEPGPSLLAIHPYGSVFAYRAGARVAIMSAKSGGLVRDLGLSGFITWDGCLRFSPSGRFVAAGGEGVLGERIVIWDSERGTTILARDGVSRAAFALAFSNSERYLAWAGSAGPWGTDASNKASIVAIQQLGIAAPPVELLIEPGVWGGITFSKDDKSLIVACESEVRVYKIDELLANADQQDRQNGVSQ